ATGTVTVDGAGSAWTNTGKLYIGNGGSGALTVSNGGAVTDHNAYIGYAGSSSGTVTIDGSSWNNSTYLDVGYGGT
ncbi:MAG: hypothetical protein E5X80_34495, partial [Mesorhizobium sp.]